MLSKKDNIILSICIPTYNRGELLYANLLKILKYDRDDIEVVVLDNASTDNTIELINTIKDDRLVVYKNKKNVGAFKNWIMSLSKGKGKYLQILNDRDTIVLSNLSKFVDLLKENDYAAILNHYTGEESIECQFPEVFYYCNKYMHPSYCIISRLLFNKIINSDEMIRKYSDRRNVGVYPVSTIMIEACKYGKLYLNRSTSMVEVANISCLKKYKSTSDDQGSKGYLKYSYTYYEPKGILYQFAYIVRHFYSSSNFKKVEIDEYLPYIYKAYLERATFEFYEFLNTKFMVERYNYIKRGTHNIELINFLFYFSSIKILKSIGITTNIKINKRLFYITLKNEFNLIRYKIQESN